MTWIEKTLPMLAPPGEGVFTVHAGREKRAALQEKLFPGQNPKVAFEEQLKELKASVSETLLLGIPSDNGGGIQRGANWGPLYLRQELLKYLPKWKDLGDIRVIPHLLDDRYLNDQTISSCREALYGISNAPFPVSPLTIAESVCSQFYQAFPNKRLLMLGGDHSVSYPAVKAWAETRSTKKGLIHLDAHTDLLDKRLGIDLCFGSWAYHVRSYFPSADQFIQLGIRSTGKERGHWEKLGLTQIWANEIINIGPEETANRVIEQLKRAQVEELYVSFDIDFLDRSWVECT